MCLQVTLRHTRFLRYWWLSLCAFMPLVADAVVPTYHGCEAGSLLSQEKPQKILSQTTAGAVKLVCAQVPVYENRAAAKGRIIPLHVIVVKALDSDPDRRRPPIFALAGGPGYPASNYLELFLQRFPAEIRRHRDLVLVDSRGTGLSNGLRCASADPSAVDYKSYVPTVTGLRHCLRALTGRADLRHYTSTAIAGDIDQVRSALGYSQIALFARSYGTRVAMEILRRYSNTVELAVLRGVLAPQVHTPAGYPQSLDYVMAKHLAACQADKGCANAFPQLRKRLLQTVRRLKEQPAQVIVANPRNGERETIAINALDFIYSLRSLAFGAQSAAAIPLTIYQASKGQLDKLAQAMIDSRWQRQQKIYWGQYFSIVCAEDLAFIDMAAERRQTAGTLLGMHRAEQEQAICQKWPASRAVSPDFNTPVKTDVPVLMLVGELDPATPPRMAQIASRQMANAKRVVFKNRAHYFYDPAARACEAEFLPKFFRNGAVAVGDTACAAMLQRIPFQTEVL